MVRTRVGYAGGSTSNPTYRSLGDHTEAIQVEYDPTAISYEELLEVFWNSHNPTRKAWSRQYMSILFYHDEEQKQLAEETRDQEAARRNRDIVTEIVPATDFYSAEAYHQKYRLRGVPALVEELEAMYPEADAWVDSTTAARINGYLGGYGTVEELREEIDDFGLSPAGQQTLLDLVEGNG